MGRSVSSFSGISLEISGGKVDLQEGGFMTAFLIALAALIIGYAVYGKIVDSVFGPTDKPTPAVRLNDGVDYMPLPTWKVFMIQLLNIAGLGPIFGALGGALWGPSV